MTRSFTTLALLAGALACSEQPLHDLGNRANDLSRVEVDTQPPPVAELANEFVGVWIGEADDPLALVAGAEDTPPPFRFPSGSTRIRLEIERSTDVPYPSGNITFGEAAPPAPATDPNVGYPVDPDFQIYNMASFAISPRPPTEGFQYYLGLIGSDRDLGAAGVTMDSYVEFWEEGRIVDGMIRVSYTETEVFGSWCALQTPDSCPLDVVYDENNNCYRGESLEPVDCQKFALCQSMVCECFESTCIYSRMHSSALTLRFSGEDELVGLFDGLFVNERGFEQNIGTVRFRREQ